MSCVASRRLLRLRQKEVLMAGELSPKRLTPLRKLAEAIDVQSGGSTGDLNNHSVQRDLIIKCRRAPVRQSARIQRTSSAAPFDVRGRSAAFPASRPVRADRSMSWLA